MALKDPDPFDMPFSSRRHTASFLIAGVALAALASPAAAQWYGPSYGYNYPPPPPGYAPRGYYVGRPLQPDEIVERLEDSGFDDVGRPRYTGQTYVVDATSRSGLRVRLVVDPVGGRVLNQVALGRSSPREADVFNTPPPGPRYGALPGRPSPYDEMPDPTDTVRRQPGGPPIRREAARPAVAPPLPGGGVLPAPADPRLAPGPDRAGEAGPRGAESAGRDPAASRPPSPLGAGQVDGMNPDRAGRPARSAARPQAPAAVKDPAAAPAAASTPKVQPKPDAAHAAAPMAEAENQPRKPVRVIGGVTPLNGGQQSAPAPQNQLDGAKPGGPVPSATN